MESQASWKALLCFLFQTQLVIEPGPIWVASFGSVFKILLQGEAVFQVIYRNAQHGAFPSRCAAASILSHVSLFVPQGQNGAGAWHKTNPQGCVQPPGHGPEWRHILTW